MIATDSRVVQFLERHFGPFCPPYTAMGLECDGRIVAGVLFNQFEGANIHATAAGTGWTRGFLRAAGEYVFGQLGCLRATLTTENPVVAQYAVRLGGEVEGHMRDHYGKGRDAILIGVLRDEWRYGSVPLNRRG